MRTTPLLVSTLSLLMSAGLATAHAAEGTFYDPTNAASATGKTSAHTLYLTIGCPGRELLAKPCEAPPAPVKVAAPVAAPVVAAPAPAPVAVVPPAPVPAPAPKKMVLKGVNFNFDQASLRSEDTAILDQDVATLNEWGTVNIEVAGHTDSHGSDEYNMKLSQQRAETIRTYLITKGIAASRVTAKGYGESQPIADNATDESRFINRRVELVPLK